MKESIVNISGHKYRYTYDSETKATKYLGPVGDGPALSEAEFLQIYEPLAQHTELSNALERELFTLKPLRVDFTEPMEISVESEDDETIVEGKYEMLYIKGQIKITIDDYEGNRDFRIHIWELDPEAGEDVVYETIERSFPMTMPTDEMVAKVMEIIREESSLI